LASKTAADGGGDGHDEIDNQAVTAGQDLGEDAAQQRTNTAPVPAITLNTLNALLGSSPFATVVVKSASAERRETPRNVKHLLDPRCQVSAGLLQRDLAEKV
jgi:hypothetical protein